MRVGDAGELELIRRLVAGLDVGELVIKPGEDDAAAWREPDGAFSVASIDASVQGVHFDLGWQSAEEVGERSLALALGDLAAKGARPTYGLVSLSLPAGWAVSDVEGLYRGFARVARETGLVLAGGDVTETKGPAVISLAVLGRCRHRPRPRSDARPGWAIAVTGPLGGAALALREHRHFELRPRLAEGERLGRLGLVAGDISDGLHMELIKFGLGAVIDTSAVPCAGGADWETAVTSGEEAELLVAAPADVLMGAGLRRIGEFTREGPGPIYRTPEGEVGIADGGYEHFHD